ncbi:MAG TPA: hypothetical protein VE505_13855 [Vicinamibacterales bacterium]|jgi:hypothetical protein|nr:hypothetical protein [Vicinamibacterales bacterium]
MQSATIAKLVPELLAYWPRGKVEAMQTAGAASVWAWSEASVVDKGRPQPDTDVVG